MANYVETTNIPATRFVTPTSRYANSTVLYYSENKKLTFTIYKREPFVPSEADRFIVLTKGLEFRPDLVSFGEYGTVDFWWKILEANGISDIMDFAVGKTIRLPNNVFF